MKIQRRWLQFLCFKLAMVISNQEEIAILQMHRPESHILVSRRNPFRLWLHLESSGADTCFTYSQPEMSSLDLCLVQSLAPYSSFFSAYSHLSFPPLIFWSLLSLGLSGWSSQMSFFPWLLSVRRLNTIGLAIWVLTSTRDPTFCVLGLKSWVLHLTPSILPYSGTRLWEEFISW